MTVSPAEFIRQLLVDGSLCTKVESGMVDWACSIDAMPGVEVGPSNISFIVVSNIMGKPDGRYMTGTTIEHPRVQIAVRSFDSRIGYTKIRAIADFLDTVQNRTVSVSLPAPPSPLTYSTVVRSISRGPVLPLGYETISNRPRYMWTLNATGTLS